MERSFQLQDNGLQFKEFKNSGVDGVKLQPKEQEYLLPHFTMLLIGKPGSGKTTLLKQLISNPQMYQNKFSHVIMVSPSYMKMGLKLEDRYCTTKFSLDWIYQKIDRINDEQHDKVYGHPFGGKILQQDRTSATGKTQQSNLNLLNDNRSRFYMGDLLKSMGMAQKDPAVKPGTGMIGQLQDNKNHPKGAGYYDDDPELVTNRRLQQMYKDVEDMDPKKRQDTHTNVLLVLDDVVSQIKKEEFNPRLAQLFLNRRHLIVNGTVSIIVVSQKYSYIPSRIRSNSNWMILFQLNPSDFETVYRDAVVYDKDTWRQLLRFVFGDQGVKADTRKMVQQQQQDEQEQSVNQWGVAKQQKPQQNMTDLIKSKKFENIGIWVEFNVYFKNFKRIQL